MDLRWVSKNQVPILYSASFAVLSILFGILWAIVLLITIELVENNFEFDLNIDKPQETIEQDVDYRNNYRRPYSVGNRFHQNTLYQPEGNMFSMDEKKKRYGQGDSRPSLMSLIKHGSGNYNKENRTLDKNQPLLAVVKNNIHLRSELSHTSKSPLYKNLIPNNSGRNSSFGVYKSPTVVMSPNVHQASGWYSPGHRISSPVMSPSVSLNQSNIYSNTDLNKSTGLEVHGSYFLNRSLLHSNLVEEEETFSLVNSKFKSPRDSRTHTPQKKPKQPTLMDETSTEAVISVLKEKSKRKRAMDVHEEEEEQHKADECSRKKIKFDPFDDTIDDLFPPVQKRKRINSKNVIVTKKRLASVGTQYENVKTNNEEINLGRPSNKRSKYGLTDDQTNELMSEERKENYLTPKISEASEKSADGSTTQIQGKEEARVESMPTSVDVSNVVEDQIFQTPLKQNETFKELKTSSALKSLKSPYKKIFPSNLAPGSVEKRRKHPVFFTAKIDVDDIQSKREEYGDRGASLKAFRLDQEEAKQRIESIFAEDEVDFKTTIVKTQSVVPTTSLSNVVSLVPSSTTASVLSVLNTTTKPDQKPAASISFNNTPAPSALPASSTTTGITTVSLPNLTGTSSDPKKTTPKKVSFTLPATTAIAQSLFPSAQTNSTSSGFSFKPTTDTNSSNASTSLKDSNSAPPPFAFNINASVTTTVSSISGGFSLSSNNTSTGPKLPSFSEAMAKPIVPATSTSIPSTACLSAPPVTTAGIPSGISFNFAPKVSSAAPALTTSSVTPAFGGLTASAANLFGASSTSTTNSTTASVSSVANVFGAPSNVINTSQSAPSFNFGQSTTKSITANVFGAPASSSQPASNVFGAPNTISNGFSFKLPTSALTSSTKTTTPGGFNFGTTTPAQPSSQGVFAPSTQSTPVAQNVFVSSAPASATSNIFGNSSSTNAFGSSAPSTTAASLFGKPATTATGFSFGNNTTTSNTSFSFGSTTTTSSTTVTNFGQTTTSSSGFGGGFAAASSKASIFRQASTATASVFGQQPTSTASVFGHQSTSNASVFGQTKSSSSVFGQPAASGSVFGQSTGGVSSSVFGQNPKSTASVFGQPSASQTGSVFGQPTTSTSVFGKSNATNAFGAPSSGSTLIFGAPSAAPTPFGNAAVNTSDKKPIASVFGTTKSDSAANPFGQPSSTGFNFGGGAGGNNTFGAPSTPVKPSFNFGAASQGTSTFGAPSTPSFATPQQLFGTPQVAAPFGAPAAASPGPGGFTIGAGGTGAPQGRAVHRARRRMKR